MVWAITPLVLSGCGGRPSRVEMQTLDPAANAAAAIKQYDTDGDGALSKVELAKCPGILKAIELYDKNADGKVSKDEIANRIQTWIDDKTASLSLSCLVTIDGKNLDGGTIELIPEEFFGESLHPASGEISQGVALLAIDPSLLPPDQADLRGVHPGVYKVKITHPSIKIPAKYNDQTTIGQEVAQDNPDLEMMEFKITSR
jgi:hypothetical protein